MSIYDSIRGVAGTGLATLGDWMARSDDDVSFGDMSEAMRKAGMALPQPTDEKPRAMFHDPYAVQDWGGWRQRPSSLTYETLRQMSTANTVIAAIIHTRIHQVAAFCRPQQGKYDKGYRVILRDRRDKSKGMTNAEQQEAENLERMLETTGFLMPDERPSDRDNFRSFCKKAVRDVLTYDQWVYERIRDRLGRPSRFIALPSETIRPAVSDVEHMDPEELRSRVSHVQVYENTIIAEFAQDDIAWNIMNPRSDLRANSFGYSPIEQIVRLVTAWLFGFEYNTKFFTQGSAIKGLLNIKGAIPDRQMRAFRRMWYSMVTGVQNAWRTPILNAEDIQWHSMHVANREMEYSAWMDWLTKMTCAVFGIDPVEINFIFSANNKSAMFDRRPNQAEVTESKDKGLRPLVSHIEDSLNQYLIWEINPDFEFSFTGLDAKAEETERNARLAEIKGIKTVNEARAEMDEDPLPGKLGEVILDPTWLQWAMQQQAAEEGAPGAENGGAGGAPGMAPGGPGDDQGDEGDEEDLLSATGGVADEDDDEHGDLLAASERLVDDARTLLRKSRDGRRQIIEIG